MSHEPNTADTPVGVNYCGDPRPHDGHGFCRGLLDYRGATVPSDPFRPRGLDPAQARVEDASLEAALRRLHHPVPADESCDAETWAPTHYGQAVDPYWIRCGLRGQHDEHGDPGNTGCTWPLTDAERAEQEQLPKVCDECDQAYPCPTIALIGADA